MFFKQRKKFYLVTLAVALQYGPSVPVAIRGNMICGLSSDKCFIPERVMLSRDHCCSLRIQNGSGDRET